MDAWRKNRWLTALMKIVAAALLMNMAALAEAPAEIPPLAFEVYAQVAFADAEWEAEASGLIRMLVPEEGVTVSVCLDGENIAAVTAEYSIGQPTDGVVKAIEALGWLSEDALDAAFEQESQAMIETEGFCVCRVAGEKREAVSICRKEDAENMVWQPIHGGARIHNRLRCSGMDVSRMLTEEAAQATGWQNCGKCRKNP